MNVKKLKLYLLISVVLAAAYSPALFTEFMMQDDYYAFTFGPDASFFIGSVGRPIQYLIIDFLSHFSAASFKSFFS